MKGYTLLSKKYCGSKKSLWFKCPHNHVFKRCPTTIVSHSVYTCPKCKIIENHKQYISHFIKFISTYYPGYNILHIFFGKYQEYYATMQCPKNHIFTIPCYKGHRSILCPQCNRRYISVRKQYRYLTTYKHVLIKELHNHRLHLIIILPTKHHVSFSKRYAIVECPHHHIFKRTISALNSNSTCPYCVRNAVHYQRYLTFKRFLVKNLVGYSLIYAPRYLTNLSIIKLQCPKGHIYSTVVISVLRGNGCPVCQASKGERLFRHLLIKHKIPYKYADTHTLNDCSNLHLDFVIPHKCAVEIDGDFHFYLTFTTLCNKQTQLHHLYGQKQRDQLKDKYCFQKHIPLMRIAYVEGTNRKSYIIRAFKWLDEHNFNLPNGITYLY